MQPKQRWNKAHKEDMTLNIAWVMGYLCHLSLTVMGHSGFYGMFRIMQNQGIAAVPQSGSAYYALWICITILLFSYVSHPFKVADLILYLKIRCNNSNDSFRCTSFLFSKSKWRLSLPQSRPITNSWSNWLNLSVLRI